MLKNQQLMTWMDPDEQLANKYNPYLSFWLGNSQKKSLRKMQKTESCERASRAHNFVDYRVFRKDFFWEFPNQNDR